MKRIAQNTGFPLMPGTIKKKGNEPVNCFEVNINRRNMKKIIMLPLCTMMFGCAHSQARFSVPPGTNQADFVTAMKACGGDYKQGGYFLFGPLILLAPAVAVVEVVRYNKRQNRMREVQQCMEAKGYKCIDNCQDQEDEKIVTQKRDNDVKLENVLEAQRTEPQRQQLEPDQLKQQSRQARPQDMPVSDVVGLAERADVERTKQWIRHGSNKAGSNFYYDPDSIRPSEKGFTVREQVAFNPNSADFSYMWRSTGIDCKNKEFRFNDFVAPGKDGSPAEPRTKEGEWIVSPDKSVIRVLIDNLCTKNGQ